MFTKSLIIAIRNRLKSKFIDLKIKQLKNEKSLLTKNGFIGIAPNDSKEIAINVKEDVDRIESTIKN